MKPDAAHAEVEERKLRDYLLSETHPSGRAKARFFAAHGFTAQNWRTFRAALLAHLETGALQETQDTPFGRKWVIEGRLAAADGRAPRVITVWFRETDEHAVRLVTAYPA